MIANKCCKCGATCGLAWDGAGVPEIMVNEIRGRGVALVLSLSQPFRFVNVRRRI